MQTNAIVDVTFIQPLSKNGHSCWINWFVIYGFL